jgi:hypothetical protein
VVDDDNDDNDDDDDDEICARHFLVFDVAVVAAVAKRIAQCCGIRDPDRENMIMRHSSSEREGLRSILSFKLLPFI